MVLFSVILSPFRFFYFVTLITYAFTFFEYPFVLEVIAMKNVEQTTICEIVLKYPASIKVFESFGLDYCCKGNRNIDEACKDADLDSSEVIKELLQAIKKEPKEEFTFENKTLSEIIDYIYKTHHIYTRECIEMLTPLMERVVIKHGKHFPELVTLQQLYSKLSAELLIHMQKEDKILFPYIKMLETLAGTDLSLPKPHFGTVDNPIKMMINEHEACGELLQKMRTITNNYYIPENACTSFNILYTELHRLSKDLHIHIHLENNILFPQSIELESSLQSSIKADSHVSSCCKNYSLLEK
jgi:regulator of cell morphogenesis and NO signaling